MAYNEFAYFYDDLNSEADYDALYQYICTQLKAHGVEQGIVADLGCGTGDLTLMLAQAGYDMIGIDQSEEMLSVLRQKADELGLLPRVLLLHQNILELDLYGTIRAAVSTFDTYNHIGPCERFERAVGQAGFFMEKGGVFVFDLNTPFKHEKVLADNTFSIECPDAVCTWHNHYDPEQKAVHIVIDIAYADAQPPVHEEFHEYTYTLPYVEQILERCGFSLAQVRDGETFGELKPDSQRYIFTAIKRYTQQGEVKDA